jgi:hypothetical protein
MDAAARAHDERRNLRPVVLSLCFAWGIACGFLIHALRAPPSVVPEKRTHPEVTVDQAGGTPGVTAGTAAVAEEPEIPRKRDNPRPEDSNLKGTTATDTKRPEPKSLTEGTPEPQPLALDRRCGLTGITARPPAPPTDLRRPSPPAPVKKDPAFLPPPELE